MLKVSARHGSNETIVRPILPGGFIRQSHAIGWYIDYSQRFMYISNHGGALVRLVVESSTRRRAMPDPCMIYLANDFDATFDSGFVRITNHVVDDVTHFGVDST